MFVPTDVPRPDVLHDWMRIALEEARIALHAGEAPIGAALFGLDGEVLGRGHNTMVATGNAVAHAEINAFTAAAGSYEPGSRLYIVSTLEPCVMCTGASMQAGVDTIIYGLETPADSGTRRVKAPRSPGASSPGVIGNVGASESRALFLQWVTLHDVADEERKAQREFIEQLLALTANSANAAPWLSDSPVSA
jgi:tRNA(Arg) A34 adenosine deaminase TadA